MQIVSVTLGQRSYPIHIGEDLLGAAHLYGPYVDGRNVAVVSNAVVAPLYLDIVQEALQRAGGRPVPRRG